MLKQIPLDPTRTVEAPPRNVWGALWEDFPFVFVALGGVSTTVLGMNLTAPAGAWFTRTWMFSSVFLVAVTALRWSALGAIQRRAALWILGANLLANGLALAIRPRVVLSPEHMRLHYELSILLLVVVFGLHMRRWKPSLLPLFLGPILIFGVLLENGGIAIGLYTETHGHFYLPFLAAPLATMLGWACVLYAAVFTTWRLREVLPSLKRSPALSAVALTLSAVLLDLHVDPYATAIGVWTWDPALPPVLFGVPAANWIAWVVALMPFSLWFFRREQRLGLEPGEFGRPEHVRALFRAVLPLCFISLGLFCLGMALVEGGASGPTMSVLTRPFE